MSSMHFTIKDLPKHIKITSENKCNHCRQSICCTYITQQIDTPRSMEDYDYLLWLVSHREVTIFKDEDGWFVNAANPCLHLQANGQCGIYHKRPKICRSHSNDCCEFDGPASDDYEKFFDSYEQLDKFCRKKFKKWDQRFKQWEKQT